MFSSTFDMSQKYCVYREYRRYKSCFYPLLFWIKRPLNIWIIRFSFLDVFDGQSINEHYDLGIAQGDASGIGIIGGNFKSAFFQAFVVKGETHALPMQQLDFIPPSVDEDEYITVQRIAFKGVLYQTRQAIKTLSHVGSLVVQMKPVARTKAKHGLTE